MGSPWLTVALMLGTVGSLAPTVTLPFSGCGVTPGWDAPEDNVTSQSTITTIGFTAPLFPWVKPQLLRQEDVSPSLEALSA